MILLDTHVAVWMTTEKRKLSVAAGRFLRKSLHTGETTAIASSTLWEVAMRVSQQRLLLPFSLADYLHHLKTAFTVLPLTTAIAERSILFGPGFPKDPTDRIISATALAHGLVLLTADTHIRALGEVPCVW